MYRAITALIKRGLKRRRHENKPQHNAEIRLHGAASLADTRTGKDKWKKRKKTKREVEKNVVVVVPRKCLQNEDLYFLPV